MVLQKSALVDKLEAAQRAYYTTVGGLSWNHQCGPPHLSKVLTLQQFVYQIEVPEAFNTDQQDLMDWVHDVSRLPVVEAPLAVRGCEIKECYQKDGEPKRVRLHFHSEGMVLKGGRVESVNLLVVQILSSAVGEAKAKRGGPKPPQAERKVRRALHNLLGNGRRRGFGAWALCRRLLGLGGAQQRRAAHSTMAQRGRPARALHAGLRFRARSKAVEWYVCTPAKLLGEPPRGWRGCVGGRERPRRSQPTRRGRVSGARGMARAPWRASCSTAHYRAMDISCGSDVASGP